MSEAKVLAGLEREEILRMRFEILNDLAKAAFDEADKGKNATVGQYLVRIRTLLALTHEQAGFGDIRDDVRY